MQHDERLSRIESKIDTVVDRIGSIDVTLVKQHLSLEEHIKRTNLLEEQTKPVVAAVSTLKYLTRAVIFTSALLTAVLAIGVVLGKLINIVL